MLWSHGDHVADHPNRSNDANTPSTIVRHLRIFIWYVLEWCRSFALRKSG